MRADARKSNDNMGIVTIFNTLPTTGRGLVLTTAGIVLMLPKCMCSFSVGECVYFARV